MSKYEEAIEYLSESGMEHKIDDPFAYMHNTAIQLAIEALEKQIPKKIGNTGMEFKALDVETKEVVMYECSPCPSCEKWLSKIYKYCPHCGQRIEES